MTGINAQPAGLSDLLEIQAGGKNPDNFAETVRPGIDILPWYMAKRLRAVATTFGATAIGNFGSFIEVPEGEVWVWWGIGLSIDAAAGGNNFNMSVWLERIQEQGLNGQMVEAFENQTAISSSAQARITEFRQFHNPLYLTPGQRVTIRVDDVTGAGTGQGTYDLIYYRLNV